MPVTSLSKSIDPIERQILDALGEYQRQHPQAEVATFRRNPVSVRIRIVDSQFDGLGFGDREDLVWPLLRRLPNAVREDITMLLLLSPDESASPIAEFEFSPS